MRCYAIGGMAGTIDIVYYTHLFMIYIFTHLCGDYSRLCVNYT